MCKPTHILIPIINLIRIFAMYDAVNYNYCRLYQISLSNNTSYGINMKQLNKYNENNNNNNKTQPEICSEPLFHGQYFCFKLTNYNQNIMRDPISFGVMEMNDKCMDFNNKYIAYYKANWSGNNYNTNHLNIQK